MKHVNFVFIRHGESCQQVVYDNIRDKKLYRELFMKYYDPTISDNGVIDSIDAGKQYFAKFKYGEYGVEIDSFDIIGSSPMLRTIETAHFMSLNYKPENIYVYPFLRECKNCDETDTAKILDQEWPMRSINEQKEYLDKIGIGNINFKYVENNPGREEPGNIKNFIEWFCKNIELPKDTINVLIITHSHVLGKYSYGVKNNAGFILKTTVDDNKTVNYSKSKFKSIRPDIIKKRLKCPSNRCADVCN